MSDLAPPPTPNSNPAPNPAGNAYAGVPVNTHISTPRKKNHLLSLIEEVEDGKFAIEHSEVLTHVIASMHRLSMNNAKPKAKITLTFSFAMENQVLEIRAESKVTAPKLARPKTVRFPTADGQLLPYDGKQLDMPFAEQTPGRYADPTGPGMSILR